MLASIPSRLLTEWMAYDRLDPVGRERDDWRAAQVSAVLAEIYRDRKKRGQAYTAADFMPEWGPPPAAEVDPEGWRAMLVLVETMNQAMGGRDLRER